MLVPPPPSLGPAGSSYRPGAWLPGKFAHRPFTLGRGCIFLFGAIAFFGGLELLYAGFGIARYVAVANGQALAIDEFESLNRGIDQSAAMVVFFAFFLVPLFLIWTYRATKALPWLAAGIAGTSPGGAVGWWFVPGIDLWRPRSIMLELWDRAATPRRQGGTWVVETWWWGLVAGTILLLVGEGLVETADHFEPAKASAVALSLALVFAGFVGLTLSAIFGLFVVREMELRMLEREMILRGAATPYGPVAFGQVGGPAYGRPEWTGPLSVPPQQMVPPPAQSVGSVGPPDERALFESRPDVPAAHDETPPLAEKCAYCGRPRSLGTLTCQGCGRFYPWQPS